MVDVQGQGDVSYNPVAVLRIGCRTEGKLDHKALHYPDAVSSFVSPFHKIKALTVSAPFRRDAAGNVLPQYEEVKKLTWIRGGVEDMEVRAQLIKTGLFAPAPRQFGGTASRLLMFVD